MNPAEGIASVRRAFIDGADEALRTFAHELLDAARRDAPPSPERDPDPGVSLRDSGRVVKRGRDYYVVFDAPYAAKQHEAQHFKHPRGGRPKFLESNLQRMARDLPAGIGHEIRTRMRTRR